jgi:hypothetical protein
VKPVLARAAPAVRVAAEVRNARRDVVHTVSSVLCVDAVIEVLDPAFSLVSIVA